MEELLNLGGFQDDIIKELLTTNYADRKIVINEGVSSDLFETVILHILKYNKQDKDLPVEKRKKIFLYLNSGGGDVIFGMNLLNVIKASKTPIVTVGFSQCASMCLYLLASGSERICFSDTVVLLHDGMSGYVTTANKGKDIHKFYNSLDDRSNQFLVDNTNMTIEYLEEVKDREMYFFGDEAKEKGIVDKIIGQDIELDYIL